MTLETAVWLDFLPQMLTQQISKRQIVHLDLLSSIFMFMEDFLGSDIVFRYLYLGLFHV